MRADSDELIFLESTPAENKGSDVTTMIDPSRGAKTRGVFEPFSFNISKERKITMLENPIDLDSEGKTVATDFEILEAARAYLTGEKEPVLQKLLLDYVTGATGAGKNRVRKLIMKHSAKKGNLNTQWSIFAYSVGSSNAHHFELTGNR